MNSRRKGQVGEREIAKYLLQAAMEQSIRDAGDDTPIVVHRRNNDYWKVTMRLDDFMEVIKEHGDK